MISTKREQEASVTDEVTDRQRSLVKRVLASSTFAKSERLSSFLLFICDLTFKGQADQINEQKIGTSVWGRRPDYDSASDGIVRTQASRLRQRLDVYFSTEGVGEAVRIVLPRGSYVPRFEPRTPEPQFLKHAVPRTSEPSLCHDEEPTASGLSTTTDEVTASRTLKFTQRLRVTPWILCGVMVCSLAVSVSTRWNSYPVPVSRGLSNSNPLWQRLFVPLRPTLLVPADSGLVLFEGLAKHETGLDDYIRGDYRRPPVSSSDPMQAIKLTAANSRYTSVVDLAMAVGLARVASDRATRLDIRYARDLRPNDLKSGNAVLSGAAQANPWVQLFEQHMNFVLQNDPQAQIFSVINRAPLTGEPSRWDSVAADPQRRVYGVVAFVPNLTGDGDVLILEGTSMSGTEAAWDYVTDEIKIRPFLKTIQKPDGSVPHFEVLIATNNMGSSAVEISAVAWRVTK